MTRLLATTMAALIVGAASVESTRQPLVIWLLGDADDEATRGVAFGIDEADRTTRLFGQSVTLGGGAAEGTGPTIGVIVTDMAAVPQRFAAVPTVRLGKLDATPARCEYSVAIPEKHLAAEDRSGRPRLPDISSLDVLAWHPSLDRFGAAQLNERFLAVAKRPLTSRAWLGWFAVKAIVEARLRGVEDGCDLTALRFDGHKGVPLYFDGKTHVLQQPAYLVDPRSPERVVGERR